MPCPCRDEFRLLMHTYKFFKYLLGEYFRFPVHRNVMCAASDFFRALLSSQFQEANQEEVFIKTMNGENLKMVIEYCYSGSDDLSICDFDSVMEAIQFSSLVNLETEILNRCIKQMDVSNCVVIVHFMDKFNRKDVKSEALQFICAHFDQVPPEDLVTLSENDFIYLLNADENRAAETFIFNTVVKYVEHKKGETKNPVDLFAKCIRLENVPNEVSKMKTHGIVTCYENIN